jgi:hypothetical protein
VVETLQTGTLILSPVQPQIAVELDTSPAAQPKACPANIPSRANTGSEIHKRMENLLDSVCAALSAEALVVSFKSHAGDSTLLPHPAQPLAPGSAAMRLQLSLRSP